MSFWCIFQYLNDFSYYWFHNSVSCQVFNGNSNYIENIAMDFLVTGAEYVCLCICHTIYSYNPSFFCGPSQDMFVSFCHKGRGKYLKKVDKDGKLKTVS